MTTPNSTALTAPDKPRIAIKDGALWREVEHPLFAGWEKITDYQIVEADKMRTTWRGGKISWELWEQVVAFMRWSQATTKCEALMTFFYNTKTKEWKAWPFPQHPIGMTVNYLTDHPLYKQDRMQFGKDWIGLGSIHHHCTTGAFQSGTDKTDEEDRDGIHITLGKMEDQVLDSDARMVFDGVQSKTSLLNWIEMPDWCKTLPQYLRYETFSRAIVMTGHNVPFDPEWKLRIIEKKTSTHSHGLPNTPASGSTASGVSTGTGTAWREGRKLALKRVCEKLSISTTEAYLLLTETDFQKMTAEKLALRRQLQQECHAVNAPPMWAEGLFSEMSDEEIAEAAERTAAAYMGHGG